MILHCIRCHIPVLEGSNGPTRIGPNGYCTNCVASAWLRLQPAVQELLARHGRKVLYAPNLVPRIRGILQNGRHDLSHHAIDWDEVAANWDLEYPAPKRNPEA